VWIDSFTSQRGRKEGRKQPGKEKKRKKGPVDLGKELTGNIKGKERAKLAEQLTISL
jgi:hypothetical protein